VTNKNRAKNFTYFDYQILLINQFSPWVIALNSFRWIQ
jgi:hypothetical protein